MTHVESIQTLRCSLRRAPAVRSERSGPSLVELAVGVVILGLLGVLALRPYLAYRARAYDLYVETAVRNAAAAQQVRLADGNDYTAGDCTALPGFVPPPGVSCTMEVHRSGFTITASHEQAGKTCTWSSRPDHGASNLSCA